MSARAPLVRGVKEWRCPQCGATDVTPSSTPNRYHPCPKLRGLATPLLEASVKARIFLVEREDYVGRELVALDPERRRPVMAMVTERADGSNDARVYAPTIRVDLKEYR